MNSKTTSQTQASHSTKNPTVDFIMSASQETDFWLGALGFSVFRLLGPERLIGFWLFTVFVCFSTQKWTKLGNGHGHS